MEKVKAPAAPTNRLGRYTLLGKLASAEVAELFLARQDDPQGPGKTVVIKKILPHLGRDPQFVHLFWNEARQAALINHPNVISIVELGKDLASDTYYMAMEFLDGATLKRVVEASQKLKHPLSAAMASQIIANAAAGLEYAHGLRGEGRRPLNLVHLDVSPETLVITYDGQVKVIDFGLAKAARALTKAAPGESGDASYVSPEQLMGKSVDRRTDIWALGVTLYWLLVGELPFRGDNAEDIIHQILDVELFVPLDVPKELQAVLGKALAKNPDERYATAAALRTDLEKWVAASGQNLSAASLSAYMNRLFPEASDPERLQIRAILGGTAAPAGRPAAAAPGGVLPGWDLAQTAVSGTPAAPASAIVAAPVLATVNPDEAPPDSVGGISFDLGGAGPDIDLALPTPGKPGAAPGKPGAVSAAGVRGRPTGKQTAVPAGPAGSAAAWVPPGGPLDPSVPSAKEAINPDDPLVIKLKKQRRTRLALRLGGAVIALGLATPLIITTVNRFTAKDPVTEVSVGFAVSSRPSGAAILVDGKPTGLVTPSRLGHWDFSVPHQLSLELAGYHTEQRKVAPGLHPPDVDVVFAKAAKIAATSSPAGATVRIGGEVVGTTPATFEAPAEKDLEVSVELVGFLPVSKKVRLEPGQTLALDTPLTSVARLSVRSEPAGARITLDGQVAANAPADLQVSPGSHRVEVQVPGLPVQSRKVMVGAGKQSEVVVKFVDPRDRGTAAELDRVEHKLTADRYMLDKIQGRNAGPDRVQVYQRLKNEDQLSEEIDQLETREQELQGDMSSHQMELEDRIRAFNEASPLPAAKATAAQ